MANVLYSKGREKFLKGNISWNADNIKVALVGGTYTGGSIAQESDEFYSAIHPHILSGTTAIKTLTNKGTNIDNNGTITYGVATADPVTFTAITSGQTIAYVVFFKDVNGSNVDGAPSTNDRATSPLIALFDSGYGIGAGTNGGDIRITWDPVNGIFEL